MILSSKYGFAMCSVQLKWVCYVQCSTELGVLCTVFSGTGCVMHGVQPNWVCYVQCSAELDVSTRFLCCSTTTTDAPQLYNRHSPAVPQKLPSCTTDAPQLYHRCSQAVPQTLPSCTTLSSTLQDTKPLAITTFRFPR